MAFETNSNHYEQSLQVTSEISANSWNHYLILKILQMSFSLYVSGKSK